MPLRPPVRVRQRLRLLAIVGIRTCRVRSDAARPHVAASPCPHSIETIYAARASLPVPQSINAHCAHCWKSSSGEGEVPIGGAALVAFSGDITELIQFPRW